MEIIELNDWSKVDFSKTKAIGKEKLFTSESINSIDRDKNLGLFRQNSEIYSSGYNGLCYLSESNGSLDYSKVIKVVSKFNLKIDDMISTIAEDEEFESYLFGAEQKDSDSLENSELIKFYDRQPIIKMKDTFISSASILLSMQFILLMRQLCRKPLYRIIDKQEHNFIGKIKGKILVGKNIKHNICKAKNERVYCEFSTSKVNNDPNRILKAALNKASHNISQRCKNNPGAFMKIFQAKAFCEEALKDVDDVKINKYDFKGLRLSGAYAHYNKLLLIARLIIFNSSLDSFDKENKVYYATYPFSINMQRLFECYCRTLIKKEFDQITRNKNVNKKVEIEIPIMQPYNTRNKVLKQDLYIQGHTVPDILLKFNDGRYYVFDVKYKDCSLFNLSTRIDRLQILAYTYFYNTSRSGLIFPPPLDGKKALKLEGKIRTDINYYEITIPPKEKKVMKVFVNET